MSTTFRLLFLAALLAVASCAHSAVLFQDNFDAIPDGQPAPAWQVLSAFPWVVQGGVYKSTLYDQIWEWSVVKNLVVEDCVVSADMLVTGSGTIVRVQNPTVGQNPTCLVVLFERYGLDVYRVTSGTPTAFDYVPPFGGVRKWSDGKSHANEWAHLTVSIVGNKLSAVASLKTDSSIIARVAEVAVYGVAPSGHIGLYRSGQFDQCLVSGFDNVTASTPLAGPVTVTGNVTDSRTGAAVAGATVAVVGTANSAATNVAGAYTLTNVAAGPNFLRISASGYAAKQIAVDLVSQTNTVNTAIDPYQSIGAAKALGAGVSVGMIGVVTAVFSDRFVIESEDRSAGISVAPVNPGNLVIGGEVGVGGTIQPNGRLLMSGPAQRTGRNDIQIEPVCANNKSLTGAVRNAGLSSQDLLVATCGKVIRPPVTLTLGDGSRLIHITDGSAKSSGPTVDVPSAVATLFQDDFNLIPDGQPDPEWLPLKGGPWVVQNGEYTSQTAAQIWEWNIVKDLIVGDCTYSADMTVPDTGLILRVQDPTVGQDPKQRLLVLFAPYGIDVYRDHYGTVFPDYWLWVTTRLWSDHLNHAGEWASLEVTMTGTKFSAMAKLRSNPDVTVVVPETNLAGYYSWEFYPVGHLGLYRSNTGYGGSFDNVTVVGNTPVNIPTDVVQVVIPASVTGTPSTAEGDYIRAVGIAGKGVTFGGDIRGVTIRKPDDLSKIVP